MAPTEAASVGLATPPRMAPSTATISRIGGTMTAAMAAAPGLSANSRAAGASAGTRQARSSR